jgi:Outer membrane protein beta-barrel family
MKEKLLIIPTLLTCLFVHGQSHITVVKGKVVDGISGSILEEATVSLFRLSDHKLIKSLRSGKTGFLIKFDQIELYRLVTTYEGYTPDTLSLIPAVPAVQVNEVTIRLRPSAQLLMQVLVHASIPPVIIKNDTISFNARAYPTRPNSTVEDLLRRIPGMEIDRDGNVTLQGQKVDKIYLDGKEFFLNDVKTATQNLPADIVAQIDAFDTQSDQAKLTGIRTNMGTKTLNIKLKEDKKRGYFGKAYAGSGNDGAYSIGTTITSLSSSRLFLVTGNANNINSQFNGTESNNGAGSGGIQTISNGTLSYRDEWGSKIKAVINGGINKIHSSLFQTDTRNTFLSDSSLMENRLDNTAYDSRSYNFNSLIEYTIDTLSTLISRITFTPQITSNNSRDTVAIFSNKPGLTYLSNTGETENNAHADPQNLNSSLSYRRRFRKEGRTLYLELNQSLSSQSQPSSLYSLVNGLDSIGDITQHTLVNQQSMQISENNGYGGTIGFTEPLGPSQILDVGYQLNGSTSKSNNKSLDFDSATGKYDISDTLTTNNFSSNNSIQRISAGYNATQGKIRYQLGLATQFSGLVNDNLTLGTKLVQHFTNWFPRASVLYSIGKGKNLNMSYSGNSVSPSIDQLQPVPNLTNPFLVRIGNPRLKQQFDHNILLNYTSFNAARFDNFQLFLAGGFTEHKIAIATTLLSGGIQQMQYINTEGTFHVSSNATYGFPLGNQKIGSGSLNIHAQYNRDISEINGATDITSNFGSGARLNINYHPEEKLFVDGSAAADFTGAHYSLFAAQNTQTWMQTYNVDASYELPLLMTIRTSYNVQITGSQAGLAARQVALWNASINRTILKDNSIELRLSAFNLLNTSTGFTQTLAQNYIETSQANTPGRLILLSIIYHFSKFNAAR